MCSKNDELCHSVYLLQLLSHYLGERVGVFPVVEVTAVLMAVLAILALRSQGRRIVQVVSLVVFHVCVSGFAWICFNFPTLPDTHVVVRISLLRLLCSIDQKRDPVFGQVVLPLVASSCVRECRRTLSVNLGVHSIYSGSRPGVSMGCESVWVDLLLAFVHRGLQQFAGWR